MEITLRNAKPDDLPLLLGYIQAYYRQDGVPFEPHAARQALLELLDHPELGQAWLICLNSDPIGYAILTFGFSLEFRGRDAFLDEMYIDPQYRGRGLGTRALKTVELFARSRKARAIHLEVRRDNERAQRFYRALGFEDRSRFFLMSKPLHAG